MYPEMAGQPRDLLGVPAAQLGISFDTLFEHALRFACPLARPKQTATLPAVAPDYSACNNLVANAIDF